MAGAMSVNGEQHYSPSITVDVIAGEDDNDIPPQRQPVDNTAGSVDEGPLGVAAKKNKRVAALDAFRGLTIVLMILVDDAGSAYSRINHSPWNGCTLADFVMPFFLFIVGVAIALVFKRTPKISQAVRKIVIRILKLLFCGILLQGGYSPAPDDLSYGVDMKRIRWFGILQRIALVCMIVAIVEALSTRIRPITIQPGFLSLFKAYYWQWIVSFAAFIRYITTTYAVYVPDWSFVVHDGDAEKRLTVKCGVRSHLGPACNAVGYVDRQVWGINHLYRQPVWIQSKECTNSYPSMGPLREDAPNWCLPPFEPEGLLREAKALANDGSFSSTLWNTSSLH